MNFISFNTILKTKLSSLLKHTSLINVHLDVASAAAVSVQWNINNVVSTPLTSHNLIVTVKSTMDMTKATLLSQESETRNEVEDQMLSMPPPPSPSFRYVELRYAVMLMEKGNFGLPCVGPNRLTN